MSGFNFTDGVRKVLSDSRKEAVRLRHEYVGTEHILLALTRLESGPVVSAIEEGGADLTRVRSLAETTVRPGMGAAPIESELPYTSRAKTVLELAMREAREVGHEYVGCEHLFLGLLREEKGIAAQVLNASGVTLDGARATVFKQLGVPSSGTLRPYRRRLPVALYVRMMVMAITWVVMCITIPIVLSVIAALFAGQPSVTVGLSWISWRNPVFVASLLLPIIVWLALRMAARRGQR